MPITDAQLSRHQFNLGASSVPGIMGRSRYSTPYDEWLYYTSRCGPTESGEPAKMGNYFEAGTIDRAEEDLGPITRDVECVANLSPTCKLVCHLDGVVESSLLHVEVKTTGLFGPVVEEWGAPGTDEAPMSAIIQCHAQFLAYDSVHVADRCYVVAFIGGRGFAIYEIPRSQKLCDLVAEACVTFWDKHVLTDTEPPNCDPSYDRVKEIVRDEVSTTTVDESLVIEWIVAKETANAAKKKADALRDQLVVGLGDCERAEAGEYDVTFKSQPGAPKVDTGALRIAGLFDTYCEEQSHRVLRSKKRKTV